MKPQSGQTMRSRVSPSGTVRTLGPRPELTGSDIGKAWRGSRGTASEARRPSTALGMRGRTNFIRSTIALERLHRRKRMRLSGRALAIFTAALVAFSVGAAAAAEPLTVRAGWVVAPAT